VFRKKNGGDTLDGNMICSLRQRKTNPETAVFASISDCVRDEDQREGAREYYNLLGRTMNYMFITTPELLQEVWMEAERNDEEKES
jgi:hypothetical protein